MKKHQSVIAKYAMLFLAAFAAASAQGVGNFSFSDLSISITPIGFIQVLDSYKNYNSTKAVKTKSSIIYTVGEYTSEEIIIDEYTKLTRYEAAGCDGYDWVGRANGEKDSEGNPIPFEYAINNYAPGATITVNYKLTITPTASNQTITDRSTEEEVSCYEKSFTFATSGVLTTDGLGWNNKKFLISGTYNGDDVSDIFIYYALISEYNNDYASYSTLVTDASDVLPATINKDLGTYECAIPFKDEHVQVVWSVYAQFGSDSEDEVRKVLYVDGEGESAFYIQRREGGDVKYTWTGNGDDNSWADADNWSESPFESYYGYPGFKSGWGANYSAQVVITNSCEIDLNEGKYGLQASEDSLVFAEGINVRLKNGTLGLGGDLSALGAKGTVVEYCNLSLPKAPDSTSRFNIGFAAGSTNIFTGSQNFYWNYRPCDTNEFNTLTVFRDGEIKCNYSMSGFKGLDSLTVLITNAVWMIKSTNTTNFNNGIAGRVEFRNGERQARLLCGDLDNINMSGLLKMHGTYDIELPRKAYDSSYVIAKHLYNTTGFDLAFDVTDCPYAMKAPILTFQMLDDAGCTASVMTSLTNSQSFTVYAAGRSDNDKTKRERNARLEWDETTRTLYYVQDSPVKGMRVIVR